MDDQHAVANDPSTTEMNAGTPPVDPAPAAAPAAAPTDWREMLPESVRDWQEAKDSDSPEKFFGQMENMRGLIGQSIRIPSEEAGPDDWQKFYDKLGSKVKGLMPTPDANNPDAMRAAFKALGMPEEPTGYELPEIQGVELDSDRTEALRKAAHEFGLTAQQFKGVLGAALQMDAAALEAQANQTEAGMAALHKEWGQAFDQKAAQAEAVRKQFFGHVPEGGMGPETIKAFASLAEALGGETMEVATQVGGKGRLTPAEAEARIGEIMDNQDGPYWKHDHPGHQAAVQRVIELQRMVAPSD